MRENSFIQSENPYSKNPYTLWCCQMNCSEFYEFFGSTNRETVFMCLLKFSNTKGRHYAN